MDYYLVESVTSQLKQDLVVLTSRYAQLKEPEIYYPDIKERREEFSTQITKAEALIDDLWDRFFYSLSP